MIECTDKKVYIKKRKKSKKAFRAFVFLLIIGLLVVYYKSVVEVSVVNICADNLKSISTQSVNESVLNVLSENSYSDFIFTEKNQNGDIVFISTDSLKVNELNKKIALKVESALKVKAERGTDVPLLAFTGIKFLSGYGIKVNIKTINVVSVECDFSNDFVSAGINQTLHSLYLTVKTTATLNMPSNHITENCVTKVLLGEAVIVGKVPEIYLNK